MLSSVSNFMVGLFGSRNQRLLKRYGVLVAAANALEPGLSALADDALRAKTVELKERYAAAPDLEALLPEALLSNTQRWVSVPLRKSQAATTARV